MTRALRSHLYVPADQERLLSRAEERGADAIILDLEDAVAEPRKASALAAALDFLSTPRAGGERWVRINGGPRGLDELRALAEAPTLDGVWLPKAEPDEGFIRAVDAVLTAGRRVGVLIESAAGLVGMPQLPPLPTSSLAQLGEVDLAASLRMRDTSDEAMVPYRARIVMECVIRGMAAPVAPVDTRFDDLDAFRTATTSLRDRGFGSRACIHPAQVAVANEVFTITDDELAHARSVLDEFEQRSGAGEGAFTGADGAMVDLATVRWARAIVASAAEPR